MPDITWAVVGAMLLFSFIIGAGAGFGLGLGGWLWSVIMSGLRRG
jgi:hypothetical protein